MKDNVQALKQTMEAGQLELELPGIGGYKNQPITDVTQGSAVSGNTPMRILKQADEIDNNSFNGVLGSTDTLTTPAMIKRTNSIVDVEGKDLEDIRDMVGEDALFDSVKKSKLTTLTLRSLPFILS